MRRARASAEAGFTILELLTVIGIIATLAAILFPVFAKAREKARTASCMSNLGQIALALHMYAQDHDDRFPPKRVGAQASLYEYTQTMVVFSCPSQPSRDLGEREWGSYQYYPGLTRDGDAKAPLISDLEFLHASRANVVQMGGGQAALLESQWLVRGWPLPEKPEPQVEEYGTMGGGG